MKELGTGRSRGFGFVSVFGKTFAGSMVLLPRWDGRVDGTLRVVYVNLVYSQFTKAYKFNL